jgi:hypothetical protein
LKYPIEVYYSVLATRSPAIAEITDINSCRCNPQLATQQI